MAQATPAKKPERLEDVLHGMKRLDVPRVENPEVDIILVPGLGTDPLDCWNYDPKKFNNGSKAQDATKKEATKYNWVTASTGLNTIASSKARILCYAYASAWSGKFKIECNFDNITTELCEGLKARRKDLNDPWRPIIFIGHSMGGLVIAEALNELDRRKEYYGDLVPNVTACLFFGVPFGGSAMAKEVLRHSQKVDFFVKLYTEIMTIMEPGNARLQKLCRHFKQLAARITPSIDLRCFYEAKDMDYGEAVANFSLVATAANSILTAFLGKQKMVTFESATSIMANPAEATVLHRNHRGLVMFKAKEDPEYGLVCERLVSCINEAPSLAKKRQGASRESSLPSLAIDALRKRLASSMSNNLERALDNFKDNSWFLQEKHYTDWEKLSPRGLSTLWLTGKPGVGRTTIALSAITTISNTNTTKMEKSEHHVPLLAFFLCDSTPLGSSPVELLKALILQLIQQNPLTSNHAKNFFQTSQRSKDNDTGALNEETNATMSIYNLWSCLENILGDKAFEDAYIIINNIHLLTPSQQTDLLINQIHDHFLASRDHGRESRRWMFTCVDGDGPNRFGKLIHAGHSHVIDLSAEAFKDKISSSLENHVMTQVGKLRQEKKYSRDQVYMIQDLMRSRAENKNWIDIQYIRLKALEDGSMEAITDLLSPATAINLHKLKRTCWLTIFEHDPRDSHSLKDMLSALALSFRPPTIEELAVLSGIGDVTRVRMLADRCKPMLQLVSAGSNVEVLKFSNSSLGEDFLWESQEGLSEKDGMDPQIQRFHGVLAWRCFSFMELAQSMPTSIPTAGEAETLDSPDSLLEEELRAKTSTEYPWEFWMDHALKGKRELAEDLVRELPTFWQEISPLRERWLASHPSQKPSSLQTISHIGMTALHTAAVFGYDRLVQELVKHNHKRELVMFNGNGYTPLHIAAMYNHTSTIETLLREMNALQIDTGKEETGTALHAAATQGHIKAMELLLKSGADPNAYCIESGPVINAAIRSGNNRAVQLLLHNELHSLESHGALAMPPLALAAALSEKEVFETILIDGKTKWTRGDYQKALDKACFTEKKDSVDVLLKEAREFLDDDTLRKCMLIAAVEQNWSCVEMISKTKSGLAGNDIFYLAAVTKREGDAATVAKGVLHEIWNTVGLSIPKEVLNAALYQAADNEKYDTVRWLLDQCGAEPNKALDTYRDQRILPDICFKNDPQQRYGNALTAAAWDGSNLMVETLIGWGANVDTSDGCALQNAAQAGRVEVVRTLLEAGANIDRIPGDEPDYRGPPFLDGTALLAACRSGHTEVVRILLENKTPANPNLGRGQFQRPILAATKLNRPEILEMLLKAGVDVKVCGTGDVSTPLINAAFGMSAEAAKSLIRAKADVNQTDANGDTAIILAAKTGKMDTLRLLIDHKADLLYENPRGESALTMAARHGHAKCFQILADAVAPLFRALKTVAQENSTMRALLAKPDGEHKFYDDETIRPLKAELHQAVETVRRTEEIRAERRAMEAAVASARKETAAHQQEMESLRKDWHEYRERTDQHQKNYEVSIEGFSSAKTKRDELQRELEVAKADLARSRSECAAARAAIEETRRNADEERRQFERAQGVDRAVIEAQEKDLRILRDNNNQLKGELERRTSRSESDSFGTPELNERPRLAGGKKEGSSRTSMSAFFKKNNGSQGG